MNKLFLLSPSFYIILAGAWIGAAINFFTTIVFERKPFTNQIILVIGSLLVSSAAFVCIGLTLEELRVKAKDSDYMETLLQSRKTKQNGLLESLNCG